MTKPAIRCAFIPISLALAMTGCMHGSYGGYPGGGMQGFPVAAAPIQRGSISQMFSVTGTVDPLQSASLSSVVSGTVLAVNAQIGQRVSAGQLLVKIDDSTLRASLAQDQAALESAQANLAKAEANDTGAASSTDAALTSARIANDTAQLNLHRDRELFAQGYVSQSDLDQATQDAAAAQAALRAAQITAQNAGLNPGSSSAAIADIQNERAAVDQAKANVQYVEAQIAQTNVSTPYDGVVTARNVDPGSLAAPGTVLMQVSQLDPVFIDSGIPGSALSFVHVGTPATITVTGSPRTWTGTVQYLNLAAAPGSLSYQTRVRIANPDYALRGGMVASVSFVQASKSNVLLAPRESVFQTDIGYSMFVIDGPKGCPPHVPQCAQEVPVDVGLQNGDVNEVSGAGLRAGEQAILDHSPILQPGMPVQVIPPQKKQAS
ncbi:MAG TPA: efflux RND transporter periplasmic adaptor subunit [Candidatus Eremiobacteraceae bacterium]|nr:efflux RND transporter periplasmic adaptor subunit [Candidatus Eremiobacteraceae bacterium]